MVDGRPTEIYVDDYLPCNQSSGLPLFSTSLCEGELWICLLEKAWAKLHKSYCMIRLGSPLIALYALTNGRPYNLHEHGLVDEATLAKKILKGLKKNERLLAVEWDNQFEKRVSGRLLSVSSPFY